jgi:hypothetical protein
MLFYKLPKSFYPFSHVKKIEQIYFTKQFYKFFLGLI